MDEQELIKHLREAFRMESEERLASIAENLMLWERNLASGSEKYIEVVYRDFHSLKGASRAVDYPEVESICQLAESFLSLCKDGETSVFKEHFDLLHQVVRLLEQLMADVNHIGEELLSEHKRLLKTMDQVFSGESVPVNLPRVEPELSEKKAELFPGSKEELESLNKGIEENKTKLECELKEDLQVVSNDESDALQDLSLSNSVRIGTGKLDSILYKTEELMNLKLSRISDYESLKSISSRFLGINKLLRSNKEALQLLQRKELLKDESNLALNRVERLQESQDLLKEQIDDLGAEILKLKYRQSEAVVQTDEMVADLMDVVKKTILQPASNLMQLLSRTIRELLSQSGKEVLVEQEGVDVTVDRRILEELQTPLIHLVRNCVDHGIESPAERSQLGKNPEGKIRISFIKEEDLIHIYISDDGRGIDYEKIRAKALKLKLYSEAEAKELTRNQLHSLIFNSGFSTAPIITEISGRGLGLSIVKEHIEKMGGTLSLETQKGRGSEFKVSIPITMSSMRGIVFTINEKHFAIPLSGVEQTLRIDSSKFIFVEGKSTITVNEEALALVSLAEVLQLKQSKNKSGVYQLIIVESGVKKIALIVDHILGVQEILLKPLGKQLKRVRNISSITVLGDGSMAPVININDVFKALSSGVDATINSQEDGSSEESQKKLLVVEDSITSRILLKNVLENAGYFVDTAVNGQEGFDKLRSNKFDLMVSDVEMPKMNGFSLTKLVKEDANLKDTPVILVTSLGSQEDKEKGIEVGADAHIVKSQFDQSALLDTIERLI